MTTTKRPAVSSKAAAGDEAAQSDRGRTRRLRRLPTKCRTPEPGTPGPTTASKSLARMAGANPASKGQHAMTQDTWVDIEGEAVEVAPCAHADTYHDEDRYGQLHRESKKASA